MVLNLYTYNPPRDTVCDDLHNEKSPFLLQGVLEALHEPNKSKMACFLELKREQRLMLYKLRQDLVENCHGTFYRHHILLDLLNMYKMYRDEFDDDTSAFDLGVCEICLDMVHTVFELFQCATDIFVFVESSANENDIIYELLNGLSERKIISIVKTVKINE
ncbi:hypothetical protein [Phthorimaea operculella granulovirus]|uniref:P18 n=2 Tax=Phthorimaea operculella granulovirus TaxID=192584 RepID=Q8JRX5_9BBAC|nr:hypothetical protein [Phthorimaea operculella granulovirus]AAM70282.1 hypothetical protein [Phthorimaea operculella granulovirus]ANY57473.1 hypothetical protein PhopGVgp084 [Phthorimaea operculella granulovirus]QBH65919.1 hypothetical protein PhopGVgp084 [Phthorimaea operculella granulovirus]QBH66049.1 hypothetical protein PhopGVgp084 [Phthorimaea operculella granulovirus]QBH66179.1 hypothetical protein PhopGVgp084 [Phthorimaea operculella granulovirus]